VGLGCGGQAMELPVYKTRLWPV